MLQCICKYLCDTYKRTRFTPKGAEWPPNIPKLIVSVALIHYKGKRTQQELFEMATMHKEGAPAIDKFTSSSQGPSAKKPRFDYSRVTKNINDIFAADPTDLTETGTGATKAPKRILIEGAPGIGKTVLAKEIAYQWATNEILTEIKIVFLLYLRDPRLQSITTTKQLVKYMSMGCLNSEKITTLVEYLVNTQGQQLCIVMDGFDEYPNTLQENSFIVDIINRTVLPEASVVVTSRPTATVSLHSQVDRRIDILGLPKEEREKYISQVLSSSEEKKLELEGHLKRRPIINGLCFVPLHLAVLLYLFQQGCLPETLTEMNESFILHTIYRHLKRHELSPSGPVDKIAKVPKKVLDIVYKLSKLAFNGLQENKLVFTFDEVKEVCPHIDKTEGAINGFGLLQAVQHYPSEGAGTTTSLNFLHYTMQEFLSALHVSNLPSDQQSSLMKKTFWDSHYNFMWMMFVGIVGIKSNVFVDFVSKGKEYKRKSGIRMAENILSDKRKRLHVFQCYMEAKSSAEAPDVISDMFKDGKISIKGVKLLPHHISSLMTYVSNSSTQWNTLQLNQCNITDIGMSVLEQFISENASTLGYVDLSGNNSSPWGVYCAIIRHCSVNNLTLTGIQVNEMKEYVNEITETLQMNTSLTSLTLNNILGDIKQIKTVLSCITTFTEFNISCRKFTDSKDMQQVNNVLFHTIIEYKCNDTISVSNDRVHILKINLLGNKSGNPLNDLNSLDASHQYIDDYGVTIITTFCDKLEILNLSRNKISFNGAMTIADYIKNNTCLLKLNISRNTINSNGVRIIGKSIKANTTLQTLDISNNIQDDGEAMISNCFNGSLKEINISNNRITSNGAKEIATAIRVNTTLKKLDLSCNMLSDDGAAFISEPLKNNVSLQELNISRNNITEDGAKYIAEAIQANATLEKLDLSSNVISNDGAAAISDSLQFNISLQELNISRNEITSEGTKKIITAIQVNDTLKQLDLSINKINDEGANFLSDGLKNNISLLKLNISHNNITDRGIKVIAEAIKINSTLQNINISKNHILTEGLLYFMEAVQNNCTLQVGNITHNNVTRSGFTSIKQCIEDLQHPIQIIASWNEIREGGKLVTKMSKSCVPDNIEEDVWSRDEYDADHLVMCLSECLKEDNMVQKINLHGYANKNITSEGAIKIAEAIKVNKILQELDISHNNISDNGAAAISDALKSNNSLQILSMSYNKIISEGAKLIAEAIKVNTTLQVLDIHDNNISDNGAAAISDALKSNNSLQILSMSYNHITSKGAKLIAEVIKVNTTLDSLYLNQHGINDTISFNMSVLTAVYHNKTLMKLSLPRVYDDDERLVRSEVEKINEERTRQDISSLTCIF